MESIFIDSEDEEEQKDRSRPETIDRGTSTANASVNSKDLRTQTGRLRYKVKGGLTSEELARKL